VSVTLKHGCWNCYKNGQPVATLPKPCKTINAKGSCFWASESCGIATGTEGIATYRLGLIDDFAINKDFKVHWNNPYVGSNSYSCDGIPTCFWSTGKGNNAQVTFKLMADGCPPSGSTSPKRSTIVRIKNNSGNLLVYQGHSLSHGIWSPCSSSRFQGD
jgi:hypothetical protein